MDYSVFNFFLVGIFLLGNLALGLWSGRKTKDLRDYAVASKSYSIGPIVMTYVATIFDGGAIFQDTELYFEDGLIAVVALFGMAISQFIRALFISKKIHLFRECLTIGDVVKKLYGNNAKILIGFLGLIFSSITVAVQIKCLGLVFEKFLLVNGNIAIIVSGIIITTYSSIGGIRAVTATDIIQFLMILCALFIMSTLAVSKVGGAEVLFSKLPADKFCFFSNKNFPYFVSLFLLDSIFSAEMIEPARFQRLLMTNNAIQTKKVFILSGVSTIIILCIIALMSYAGYILYPNSHGDFVLTMFHDIIPDSFKGIIIIGFIAIIFSSADSWLHSAGLSATYDLVGPLLKRNFNNLSYIRVITFIIGLLCIAISYANVLASKSMVLLLGLIAPLFACPILLGILGLKPEKKSFWIAAIFTIISFIALKLELFSADLVDFAVILSTVINTICFISTHIFINKGIAIVPDKQGIQTNINGSNESKKLKIWESIKTKITAIFTYPLKFAASCKAKVETYGASYVLFGVFYRAAILMPYFIWGEIPAISADTVLYFKIIGVVLSGLLICSDSWPKITQPYLPAFWYISLTYCLPFLSTIMLLLTNGAPEYTMNTALTIMFLIILVDWVSAIGIGIVGVLMAVFIYKNFIEDAANPMAFKFSTIYSLTYQIIFGTIIGLIFARRKQLKTNKNDGE
jgi:Na+/proline symporter